METLIETFVPRVEIPGAQHKSVWAKVFDRFFSLSNKVSLQSHVAPAAPDSDQLYLTWLAIGRGHAEL